MSLGYDSKWRCLQTVLPCFFARNATMADLRSCDSFVCFLGTSQPFDLILQRLSNIKYFALSPRRALGVGRWPKGSTDGIPKHDVGLEVLEEVMDGSVEHSLSSLRINQTTCRTVPWEKLSGHIGLNAVASFKPGCTGVSARRVFPLVLFCVVWATVRANFFRNYSLYRTVDQCQSTTWQVSALNDIEQSSALVGGSAAEFDAYGPHVVGTLSPEILVGHALSQAASVFVAFPWLLFRLLTEPRFGFLENGLFCFR